jgi:carbamoyl-phosphate synthase large subunit
MPKDNSIKSVLIVGSGPIIIGQACEFDYSGSQAARSLREEGIKVYLINSNPATIMTDPMMADKVYLLPLTIESLEQILQENQIDAVLPTMGGQTALNLCKEADEIGLWNRTLTQTEITQLYNGGVGITAASRPANTTNSTRKQFDHHPKQ